MPQKDVKDKLDKLTTSELCDFMREWFHSLSDDRFSRVQSIAQLEFEFRQKVAMKQKSNDAMQEAAGSGSKSPNKRSLDMTPVHNSPNVASNGDDLSDWICIFCKLTSHARGLGDLFGPYFIDFGSTTTSPSKPRVPPKKMKYTEYNNAGCETWFHDTCISWASGVYLIGSQIKNVESIIKKSSQNICFECHMNGANIGCIAKGCHNLFHYICAKESNCLMDETTFTVTCKDHIGTVSCSSNNHSDMQQIDSRIQSQEQPHSSRSFIQ